MNFPLHEALSVKIFSIKPKKGVFDEDKNEPGRFVTQDAKELLSSVRCDRTSHKLSDAGDKQFGQLDRTGGATTQRALKLVYRQHDDKKQ